VAREGDLAGCARDDARAALGRLDGSEDAGRTSLPDLRALTDSVLAGWALGPVTGVRARLEQLRAAGESSCWPAGRAAAPWQWLEDLDHSPSLLFLPRPRTGLPPTTVDTSVVELRVAVDGRVREAIFRKSAGSPSADSLAMHIARQARFDRMYCRPGVSVTLPIPVPVGAPGAAPSVEE